MLPQLERALIAGHDVVLLGERGQGKTRLLRSLVALLDEWTPVIDGSELGEHPYQPITPVSRRRAADLGDGLPVAWRHRDERYTEKLATPDTSVADLIGDVDPVKVAEGRSLGDPETIHYGLVPRAHRGIVAINELPDLAERIQVSLLNVMEERDIQVRGYTLRLPLDVLLVASANPEDYTNRGRIITPLKDRFGAEVRTHYPLEIADEVALVEQEASLVAEVPSHLRRGARPVHPAAARVERDRPGLRGVGTVRDRRRGDRRRGRAAPVRADRRAAAGGPPGRPGRGAGRAARQARVRVRDGRPHRPGRGAHPPAAPLGGRHRPGPAAPGWTSPRWPRRWPSRRCGTGERVPAVGGGGRAAAGGRCCTEIARRLDAAGTEAPGPMAAAAELALELLYLTRRLAKEIGDDDTVSYG